MRPNIAAVVHPAELEETSKDVQPSASEEPVMGTIRVVWSMVAVIVISLVGAASAGPTLIGGASNGIIYDVDPLAGIATNPRDAGLDGLAGLAFSPAGMLFGYDGASVYMIDAATGSTTLLVDRPNAAGDFDFDPASGELFAFGLIQGAPPSFLFTLNVSTGAATPVGRVSGHSGSVGIDNGGRLYVLDSGSDELVHVDKTDAQVLQQLPLSADLGQAGLDFTIDDTLFVVDGGLQGTGTLYTLDLASGMLTEIGGTGVAGGLTSLAFVPEPGALLLFGLRAASILYRGTRRWRTRNP